MAGKTLNGILTVNFNVKEACYSFIPTKQMLQKARHPRYDEYKQCDSDFEVERLDTCFNLVYITRKCEYSNRPYAFLF